MSLTRPAKKPRSKNVQDKEMSRLRAKVIAILASDIHLQHRPPIARILEPNWYLAMRRPLVELDIIRKEYNCPVIYAGDIFNVPNPPPELINFAIQYLPPGWSIPGQHDLPMHNYKDMSKSAYWTLVQAGVLKDLIPDKRNYIPGIAIHAFPWGYKLHPREGKKSTFFHLAVVHRYIWHGKNTVYPGASANYNLNTTSKLLRGYNAAVFGDNHKGFISYGSPTVLNCGTFMRRTTDEMKYDPCVGLLHMDGSITRHFLDTSQDVITDGSGEEGGEMLNRAMIDFMEEAGALTSSSLDFKEIIRHWMNDNKVGSPVRHIILKTFEGKNP